MPIYKDKKRNTWYAVVDTYDPITNKRKQLFKRGFQTRREAQKFEAEYITENKHESSITFWDMAELRLDYKNPKEATRHQEEMRIKKYMPFYDEELKKITKNKLMEWTIELRKMDISTSLKNYCITVCKGVFQFASDFYGIPNNAIMLKKLKKQQSEIQEMQTWTIEEFNQFISHVELKEYANCYTFLYWIGCRRGEALALQYTDFDMQNETVKIYHAIKYYKDGFIDLKNMSSIRTLKLPHHLFLVLKPVLEARNEDSPFVFGGEQSLPITNLQRNFNKAIKASGVKKIRLHDLRHSFATNMINHGGNIVAVSKYLGHASIEQTLQTYTHLLEKTEDQLISTIDSLM